MKKAIILTASAVLSVILMPAVSLTLRNIYGFVSGGAACGCAAWLLYRLRRDRSMSPAALCALAALLGSLSFVVSITLTGSLESAFADIIYVFPALTLFAIISETKAKPGGSPPSRTSAIIAVSAVAAAAVIIYAAAVIAAGKGSFGTEVYIEWFRGEESRIREIMSSLTVVRNGEIALMYGPENLDFITSYIIMIMPAVITICFFISSWLATAVFSLLCRVSGEYADDFPNGWKVTSTAVSCAVFVFAYLGSLLLKTDSIVYTVCGNLVLLLTPLFTLLGVSGIAERFVDYNRRGSAVIMTILALSFLILNPVMFFSFISFAGIFYTILPRIRELRGRSKQE